MNPPAAILVLRAGALGDFILTLPALMALRQVHPGARLELRSHPERAALAQAAGLADRISDINAAEMAGLFLPQAVPPGLTAYFRGFDRIICFLTDHDRGLHDNFQTLGIRDCLMIPPRPDLAPDNPPTGGPGGSRKSTVHVAAIWRAAAVPGATAPPDSPRLQLPTATASAGQQQLQRLTGGAPACLLHPGSGSPRKNWPLADFMALAEALQRHGLQPVFMLGEAETDMLPTLRDKWPVVLRPPLLTAAGILTAAACYVGNDSGITHLAAILGTPTTALFGPTNPAVWGPWGQQVRIIRSKTGGTMEGIGLSEVLEKSINCGSEKNM